MDRRLLAALLVVLAAGLAGTQAIGGDDPPEALEGRVTRVVDGDTIHVRVSGRDETIRYIGIDTPETHKPDTPVQCFGPAAAAENARLVADQDVELRPDVERRDRFGRLLAYVTRRTDGLDINAALLRGGYARTLRIPPNVRHSERYRAIAEEARALRHGLWDTCP